jgi:GNAT superfamily N-acetyltransferase
MNVTLAVKSSASERELPALYMVRGRNAIVDRGAIPPEYEVLPLPMTRRHEARAVVELESSLTDRAWDDLLARVLPGGFFVLRHRRSGEFIGTASAIDNPEGSRFYFPAGGQLGYLAVDAAHRGQGLGYGLVVAVVERFRTAGYQHLWLGVQGWRVPAIRTYLRAGYRPFLHSPNLDALVTRWMRVFEAAGLTADVTTWPRDLPSSEDGSA